jgi:hypothetical protein
VANSGGQPKWSGSHGEVLEGLAPTPTWTANAVRMALRRMARGEPDAHPTICAKRPAGSGHGDRRGRNEHQAWPAAGTANAVRLALRRQTHGGARAERNSENADQALQPRPPVAIARQAELESFRRLLQDLDSNHIDARVQVTVCCAYPGDHTPVAGAFKLVEA